MIRRPPRSTLFPYTTLFRSRELPREPKLAANWVMGELAAALNKENLEVGSGRLPAARLAGLLRRICDQTISGKIAKEVFETMWRSEEHTSELQSPCNLVCRLLLEKKKHSASRLR